MRLVHPLLLAAMTCVSAVWFEVRATAFTEAIDQVGGRPTLQSSSWGQSQYGLQCRATVPVEAEQGEAVQAIVELQCHPAALEPTVHQLNLFLPHAFLTLS